MVHFDDAQQTRDLSDLRKQEEEELIKILSVKHNLPYIDLSVVSLENDAVALIKEEVARKASVAAFAFENKKEKRVGVAVFSPQNEDTKEVLRDLESRGFKVVLYMSGHGGLERVWDRYKDLSSATRSDAGVFDISSEEVAKLAEELKTTALIKTFLESTLSQKGIHQISKVLEIILSGAISVGASDIHVEPQEENVRIRYRLDGVLHDVADVDHKTYKLVISRLKLLSGLKLNVSADTQDGRFSIKLGEADIEIRTSVLPSTYGEGVVMRILNPASINLSLEDMGIEPGLLAILLREIEKPNGMILTTGPTGSGKTTTLYSFLRKVYSPEIKIITIEDPVEYHLKGISQTQVDADSNYTFLSGLRAALRQDPDVIMVGEIRDGETAKIAINAALTGHLVLSTLHTNNAAGTIPRLIDLGVNPKVIGAALSVSIAQRLLRRLCSSCKKERVPTDEERATIERILLGVTKKKGVSPEVKNLWEPVGCEKCNHTGYKGRVGIYEAIRMDEKLEQLIAENPSEREIVAATKDQGILEMSEDGVVKVLAGMTSLEELSRTIDLEG